MSETRAKPAFPADHPAVAVGRVGVLLVNLGTPDSTDRADVRRYLAQFLSDRRVIELNPLIWQPILRAFVLTFRPRRTARAYEAIWLKDTDESPLRRFTRGQAERLQARLDPAGETLVVDWAMRYGQPAIADRVAALKAAGCERILVFPLYPQYSATTTATVIDALGDGLKAMRWQPAIRTMPAFHDDPAYIDALARSVETHLAGLDWTPELIVASFHGLPQRYFEQGDPYHCHCAKTARLLGERLGLPAERLRLTFQSRFGPQEWLQPYTDKTLAALPGEGIKKVAVITPGFVADCVETLEEIAIGGREAFEEAGGEKFTMIPCLNDSDPAVDMLATLTGRELAGWWTRAEAAAAGGTLHAAQ
ncbi:MAG: ferrochelatase [Azospirillaceae bacterium]